jgi:TolA-binding protein
VRHGGVEKRVAAGDQWPSCAAHEMPEAAAPAPASGNTNANAATGGPSMASSLGEQNDLFAEGILAKHRGDVAGAVAAFDRFLTTYPSSPLAQSAAVERMRLLHASGSPRATAATRQYLSRYPSGFATAEAEAIVAGGR